MRLLYVGIILLATLTSLHPDLDASAISRRLGRMVRPALSGRDIIDGARNLALFAGWGLLWMITTGPGHSRRALRNAVLTGAALSFGVEALQLLSDTRVASVMDLMTNTAGALVGALVSVLVVVALARRTGARSFVGIPASIFAVSYGAACLGEALIPLFRQELQVRVSGGLFARLTSALAAFRWDTVLTPVPGDFLLFLPAGAFGVAWLYEAGRGYRSSAAIVVGAAVPLLMLAEIAHGVVGIRIHGGALVTHVTAVALGAALAATGLSRLTRRLRGPSRPRVLLFTYSFFVVLWAVRPFRPESSLRAVLAKLGSDWWIPLRSLGARVDLFSVVDVFAPFLLYLPLGALLAVWPLRLRGRLSGFAPALYLACGTELVQMLIATRTLDVTDLIVQASGTAVGWLLVRRAGFRPYGELWAPHR